ncbi:MAG: MlaE family lipid ABC transporter permease subunit [Sedimentisphaerales bacterium]|nr:MlaE family lipid ABC transporter permease subunit [Sedimentisphaerales bacterium]
MEGVDTLTYDLQQGDGEGARLVLKGRLDKDTVASIWRQSTQGLQRARPGLLTVHAEDVEYCDAAGIALLAEYKRIQEQGNGRMDLRGLRPQFQKLMAVLEIDRVVPPPPAPRLLTGFVRSLGERIVRLTGDLLAQVNFTGEVFAKLVRTMRHPGSLRGKDMLLIAEKAGANAVGITALLGFLIGLIIAFQSAASLQKFGAEVFVADLVVLGLLRELGPLITAVVLASRSGSAFAAEIGTMKVNEEIDALTTMAVDPVQYLVVPRVIAAVLIMPLLTMFNELFGLIGCGLVMTSWHVPVETYVDRIREAATLTDLFSGLVKTLVFGALVGGLGCLRGLQTETGPSAVGDSATRAVVSGIIAIIVADGVFAVAYYFLGI